LQVTLHDLVTVVTVTVTVLHHDSCGLQWCNRLSIFKLTLLPQLLPVPRCPILFLCPLSPHLCALVIPSLHLCGLAFMPSWPCLHTFVALASSSCLHGPGPVFAPLWPSHRFPLVPIFACLLRHVALSAALGGSSLGYYGHHQPWPHPCAHCGPAFACLLWPHLRMPIVAPSSHAHRDPIFMPFMTPFS
jgi:hypothetical protein